LSRPKPPSITLGPIVYINVLRKHCPWIATALELPAAPVKARDLESGLYDILAVTRLSIDMVYQLLKLELHDLKEAHRNPSGFASARVYGRP